MFCTQCGAQNPDTASFCEQCGSPLTKPTQPVTAQPQKMFDMDDNFENVEKLPENAQLIDLSKPVEPAPPVQPMPTASPVDLQKPGQGVQPGQPAYQQPVPPTPPMQPTYQQPMQQPMQPGGMQPAYAAPVYAQPGAQKKSMTVPIVLASISAVLVAFLVVLFAVIIPNSGIKGKLRHRWSVTEGGTTLIYDFKKNTISESEFDFDIPIKWDVEGDDHLTIEMTILGFSETLEYIFSISDDGKTLTLKDAEHPSSKAILNRIG